MPGVEPLPPELRRAVDALAAGGVVVYPTETLYGLGVDATSEDALQRLSALKGREAGKPISVLVSSREMLVDVVSEVPPSAEKLIQKFWPGALTLVLPARPTLSAILTAGRETIGVRISSHPVAQALVTHLGRPITATSANTGGMPPPNEVALARRYFGSEVDVYVDEGRTPGGPSSTVVDLSGREAVLVREGTISVATIEQVCGLKLVDGRRLAIEDRCR